MEKMEKGEIEKLINEAWQRRRSFVTEQNIEAYRLLHRPESPLDIAVDIYKDNAVIHLFSQNSFQDLQNLQKAIMRLLGISHFFFKDRTKENKKIAKTSKATEKERQENDFFSSKSETEKLHQEIVVEENGHQFLINLSDYLDCGLFLDHRPSREWIGRQSKGKIILNTFAYTGSFTVYAAKNGASKTYSVDLSKTYCDWIKRNLQLNDLSEEQNWVYKMDTFEFFKYAQRKKLFFDIIIIDPPTFSRNKNKRFSVQKDHRKLIEEASALLSVGGFILFSNNCLTFQLDKKLQQNFEIEDITTQTIPFDFPFKKQILTSASPNFWLREAFPIHNCFLIKKTL